MPNIKSTLKKLPKTLNILPKWRNFAKSGCTAHNILAKMYTTYLLNGAPTYLGMSFKTDQCTIKYERVVYYLR